MPKQSAGLLMYRRSQGNIEVLLVHPGGPFWSSKDRGAWSIPKGEFTIEEDPLATAIREFQEETGFIPPSGKYQRLSPIKQTGGKVVYAWALEGNFDATTIQSNSFTMEWPPRSGKLQRFPEVDRAEWFEISVAKEKILRGQIDLLEELESMLKDFM
jgi:predicted NUDIX family NTP pyrophosphohydrolase